LSTNKLHNTHTQQNYTHKQITHYTNTHTYTYTHVETENKLTKTTHVGTENKLTKTIL